MATLLVLSMRIASADTSGVSRLREVLASGVLYENLDVRKASCQAFTVEQKERGETFRLRAQLGRCRLTEEFDWYWSERDNPLHTYDGRKNSYDGFRGGGGDGGTFLGVIVERTAIVLDENDHRGGTWHKTRGPVTEYQRRWYATEAQCIADRPHHAALIDSARKRKRTRADELEARTTPSPPPLLETDYSKTPFAMTLTGVEVRGSTDKSIAEDAFGRSSCQPPVRNAPSRWRASRVGSVPSSTFS